MKKEKNLFRLLIAGLCIVLLSFAVGCDQQTEGYNDATDLIAASDCPANAICQSETPGSYSTKGPYRTATKKLGIHNATLYYPTDSGGSFGAFVYCPPFLTMSYAFQSWGPWLASHGIGCVIFDTTTIMDYPDQRSLEQKAVVDRLKSSGVSGLDTNRIGVMGWSMGGGATWINASRFSGQLKAAISLAGHNMSAMTYAMQARGVGLSIPLLALNGGTDYTILGGMGQSETVYRNATGPKILCVTFPAGHFNWGAPNQGGTGVAALTLAFAKRYLNDDTRWTPYIKKPSSATKYQTSGIN